MMKVRTHSENGSTLLIEVSSTDQVCELRQKLAKMLNRNEGSVSLLKDGKILDMSMTIGEIYDDNEEICYTTDNTHSTEKHEGNRSRSVGLFSRIRVCPGSTYENSVRAMYNDIRLAKAENYPRFEKIYENSVRLYEKRRRYELTIDDINFDIEDKCPVCNDPFPVPEPVRPSNHRQKRLPRRSSNGMGMFVCNGKIHS